MTEKNSIDLIQRYGADPARWPEDMRETALQILAAHPDAAHQEAALDAALHSAQAPMPSDLLRARILREAKTTAQDIPTALTNYGMAANDRVKSPFKINATKWGAVAATLIICGALGFQALSPAAVTTPVDDAIWQEAAADLGLTDLYGWVEGTDTESSTRNEAGG